MNGWSSMRRTLASALLVYAGMVAMAQAQPAAKEASPKATPKTIACMDTCEQTQMTCLQTILQIPLERRTIKEINQVHACNRTEETCDHRCRGR